MQTENDSYGKVIGNYVIDKRIGEGCNGEVFKAINTITQEVVAIKVMSAKKIDSIPQAKLLLNTEASIMHDINHPNILHLYEFLKTTNNYYLVVQYCNQGDLVDYKNSKPSNIFDEKEAVGLLKQILNGFSELRARNIMHRDFKMENIFMHNDRLIIGDFGLAKSGVEFASTHAGTKLTMAPEILATINTNGQYSYKADLWSIGVVFYQMLFDDIPFFGLNNAEMMQSINRNCGTNLKFPKPVSEEAKDLLRRLLMKDPDQRINWTDLFNHSIFDKFNNKLTKSKVLGDLLEQIGGPTNIKKTDSNENLFEVNQHRVFNSDTALPTELNPAFINLFKNIIQKDVVERKMNAIEMNEFQTTLAIKEISERYSHEKNKIMFLVFTVKRIQRSFIGGLLLEAAHVLMEISLLIIQKTVEINKGIAYHLGNKVNPMGINLHHFELFCQSQEYAQTLRYFQDEDIYLAHYQHVIADRANQNGLTLETSSLLAKGLIKPSHIDSLLHGHIESLEFFLRETGISKDLPQSTLLRILLKRLNLVIPLDTVIPYFTNTSTYSKFDWENFLINLENL